MKIINFLDEFTTANIEKKRTSRRQAFGRLGDLGKKAALVAFPFGLSTLGNKVNATPTDVDDAIGALQLALTLEYLEAEFYIKALDSGVLSDYPKAEAIYMQISKHESAHVDFLKNALADNSVSKPTFDFTAGGAFDPFNESGVGNQTAYAQLLALAQAFEDTGVRAYKGQAGNLMGVQDGAFLTAALQIHSVEARHASEIRRLRGLEGWITGNQRGEGMPEATQAVYNGEENITQAGVDATSLGSGDPFTMDSATQSYDEPMTGETATTIAGLFITG